MPMPLFVPWRMRSSFPAPMFCAVKLDIAVPRALKPVMAKLLSLMAAE